MRTREEALAYGLSLPDTYKDAPFHDPNWQLAVRTLILIKKLSWID